jgi:hypothetical protein
LRASPGGNAGQGQACTARSRRGAQPPGRAVSQPARKALRPACECSACSKRRLPPPRATSQMCSPALGHCSFAVAKLQWRLTERGRTQGRAGQGGDGKGRTAQGAIRSRAPAVVGRCDPFDLNRIFGRPGCAGSLRACTTRRSRRAPARRGPTLLSGARPGSKGRECPLPR